MATAALDGTQTFRGRFELLKSVEERKDDLIEVRFSGCCGLQGALGTLLEESHRNLFAKLSVWTVSSGGQTLTMNGSLRVHGYGTRALTVLKMTLIKSKPRWWVLHKPTSGGGRLDR
jgi:hypothetical protein